MDDTVRMQTLFHRECTMGSGQSPLFHGNFAAMQETKHTNEDVKRAIAEGVFPVNPCVAYREGAFLRSLDDDKWVAISADTWLQLMQRVFKDWRSTSMAVNP